jgi:hypothetical protein
MMRLPCSTVTIAPLIPSVSIKRFLSETQERRQISARFNDSFGLGFELKRRAREHALAERRGEFVSLVFLVVGNE